ncbi:MAG: hypothetical protein Q8P34_10950 [Bacteroidota bacterium]|nr:hypothetical protein [Bacteroidota bacterium]
MIFIGLFAAGNLLAYLVIMAINLVLRRVRLFSILKGLAMFIAIMVMLYYSIENKRILAFILPLGIPALIGGLLTLRR